METFDYIIEMKTPEGWIKIALFKHLDHAMKYFINLNKERGDIVYRLFDGRSN